MIATTALVGTGLIPAAAWAAEGALGAAVDDAKLVVPGIVAPASGGAPELQVSGGGFTTSSGAGVTVGPSATDGTSLATSSGALGFTPLDVRDVDGHLVNDASVVFPRVTQDADLVVRPLRDGLETFATVAGPQAPERFRFRFDLQPGQRLVELDGGAVAVVAAAAGPERPAHVDPSASDEPVDPAWATDLPSEPIAGDVPAPPVETPSPEAIVAVLPPAWAQDAMGFRVPTRLSAEGDVVVLTVDHRRDGVSYPVVADPQVQTPAVAGAGVVAGLPTWRNLYDWPSGHGSVGWAQASTAPDGAYTFARGLSAGPGLWVWPTGGRTYQPGAAEWRYRAPGTTRVLKATVQLAYPPRLLSHHCIGVVLRDAAGGERSATRFCKPPQPPKGNPAVLTLTLADPVAAAPTTKDVAVRLELPCDKPNPSACAKNVPSADPVKDGLQIRSVDMTLVDDDAPVPAPAGEWYDLRDRYVNGQRTHALTLAASDAGAGVRRVAAEEIGKGEIASASAPCDPTHRTAALDARICPASFSAPATVDARGLSEGKHLYRLTAQDLAGTTGASPQWAVYVDRTAPRFPAAFQVRAGVHADPAQPGASVDWDPADDPLLADGSPGSGVGSYTYRYRLDGGAWSAPVDTGAFVVDVPSAREGDTLELQVWARDLVGNVSAAVSATTKVAGPCEEPTANGFPAECQTEELTEDFTEEGAELEPIADDDGSTTWRDDPADPFDQGDDYERLVPDEVDETDAMLAAGINPLARMQAAAPPQAPSAAATYPGHSYRISVGGGGWTTVRNKWNSVVIGNAHTGWTFRQVGDDEDYNDEQVISWRRGQVSGGFRFNCGWVQRKRFIKQPLGDSVTDCTPMRAVPQSVLSDGYNCHRVPDGPDADDKPDEPCTSGTRTRIRRPTPMWANVFPNPAQSSSIARPTTVGKPIRNIGPRRVSRGWYVDWRYTTKPVEFGGVKFVLVRDVGPNPERARTDNSNGVWVFIRRSALPRDLCPPLSESNTKRRCGGNTATE